MSLHVIISSPRIASPPRTGAPRIPVPESVQRLRNAPALSVTRRRRKIGFLRRERRFDVVSHTRFAPYFKLPPNTSLESYNIVVLIMWFL